MISQVHYEDAEKLHDKVAECVAAYNTYLEETADEENAEETAEDESETVESDKEEEEK